MDSRRSHQDLPASPMECVFGFTHHGLFVNTYWCYSGGMATSGFPDPVALAGLSTLDDTLRRQLYEYVTECGEPTSREQAAAAAGIGRTLAAYHLDKLADAGLLVTSYQRPAGRSGPGAGRPAKLYTRAEQELNVSVPPRDYELLARLLVSAVQG